VNVSAVPVLFAMNSFGETMKENRFYSNTRKLLPYHSTFELIGDFLLLNFLIEKGDITSFYFVLQIPKSLDATVL
jgi:hypothetical protein